MEAYLIAPAAAANKEEGEGAATEKGGAACFDGDFYGSTMSLVLVGSLRSELKCPSFPALVAQITQDVSEAGRQAGRQADGSSQALTLFW